MVLTLSFFDKRNEVGSHRKNDAPRELTNLMQLYVTVLSPMRDNYEQNDIMSCERFTVQGPSQPRHGSHARSTCLNGSCGLRDFVADQSAFCREGVQNLRSNAMTKTERYS